MLIELIIEIELRVPRPSGRTYTPITGELHDKAKISKENLRVNYYLLLNYSKRDVPYLHYMDQITYN